MRLHIPLLKKGDFFNTVTRRLLRPECQVRSALEVRQPYSLSRFGQGWRNVLCRSDDMIHGVGDNPVDGNCREMPLRAVRVGAWWRRQRLSARSEFMNFPALVLREGKVDIENTVIWSAKSSHIDAAKQLVGLAMRRRLESGMRAPMWSGVYTLTTKIKKFTEKLSRVCRCCR